MDEQYTHELIDSISQELQALGVPKKTIVTAILNMVKKELVTIKKELVAVKEEFEMLDDPSNKTYCGMLVASADHYVAELESTIASMPDE